MSKAERNRRRRHKRRPNRQPSVADLTSWRTPPAHAVRGGTPEARALAATVADAREMPCRATFLDDPVFGRILAVGTDGTVIPGRQWQGGGAAGTAV